MSFLHDNYEPHVEQESNPLEARIDFTTWALCLPRWLFRCRTQLGWHLRRSFSALWQGPSALPTTMFPLPVPHPGCFDSSGPSLSKKDLTKVAQRRLLHIIVFCLDYLYLGRFPSDEELRRRPNAWQLQAFDRIRSLIAVCGEFKDEFPLIPGRSGPELGALLYQLEQFFVLHPELGQSYTQHQPVQYRDDVRAADVAKHPGLQPYKSLDASRLRLVGKGQWPMADFIDGALWFPFQEPRFLHHG